MDEAALPEPRNASEPWGRRLWLSLAVVVLLAACLQSYGIATWPMADDEVPSLVEMGLAKVDAAAFSVPASQVGRLPRAQPVWYSLQRFLLDRLPKNELGFRLPSLAFGILTSLIAFLVAARWRGLWFAVALSIVLNLSQPFIYLSQVNRFYSLPLLLLTLALGAIWIPGRGWWWSFLAVGLAILTVLSHNLSLLVFVIAFMAAVPAFVLGSVPLRVVLRSGAAALAAALLYVFHVRPLLQGWASTGNPAPVLVSFAAHAGVPTLALALFGVSLSVVRREAGRSMLWWALLFAGSACAFQFTHFSWNPRYFIFFMPAMWILAAHAVEFVARRIDSGWVSAAWYGCVAMILLPGIVSHYQDGSRHDYRQAAAVLLAEARDGQPILSDDAETISYYLPDGLRRHLLVRTKVEVFPASEFFLVARSNAWTPLPSVPGRHLKVVAEISHRRFDQFSHVLRVFRVAAVESSMDSR